MLRNFLLVISTAVLSVAVAHGSGALKPKELAILDAKEELGKTLGVAPTEIELESISAVDWSDAGLGCHKHGFGYAQVITPGFRLGLRAVGKLHIVHVGGGRAVVCQPSKGSAKTVAGNELANALQLARRDLLARVEVAEDGVRVKGVSRGTWKERPALCDGKESTFSAATSGFFIQLLVDEKVFLYFANANQAVACGNESAA